ncbi:MAG: GNAT family N-acetyltransferase [Actinobacteria bacterium]|jgi:RimJ/RimL family protein N-acetyltransferase|nr:GNAT family N-acetyltransferase [Actinomycetota bacterium]
MKLNLDKATTDDFNRLKNLRLSALKDSPNAFGAKYSDLKDRPDNYWQQLIKVSNWCLVSADGLDIALLAVDKADKDRKSDCWLSSWWIDENYRGKGVSKVMAEWVYNLCREKGWQKIGLGVWPDNKNAIAVYLKLGFELANGLMPSRSIPGLMYQPMYKCIGGDSK